MLHPAVGSPVQDRHWYILDRVQQRAVEMIKPLELVVREAEASLEIPETQWVQSWSSLL